MNIDKSQQSQWSTSLCGCGEEGSTCCITCLLPCITFGQIAEILDEGQSSCATQGCLYGVLMSWECQCLLSCAYREKLRSKFGLPEQPCGDYCVHCCCGPCALCQEHAELRHRGLDPSKGWVGPPNVPTINVLMSSYFGGRLS
ncbi:hypothetical protein RGQ29_023268 [Quercus rubra]|uniref:Uncharacterized protein n=1 Tax=Quercus rubra TaxID=3512 RepID=A0AAN7F578_QUERU|nr:hypothetical protein RGQ29_023268 [Quercus rubra]